MFGALRYGFRSGYAAGLRYYFNPDTVASADGATRLRLYSILWAYYENSAFERLSGLPDFWQKYREDYRLGPFIRSLYNPTSRLVDFYASAIYPGVLAVDGEKLPDGIPLAIPLADDTPRELKAAIGQFWEDGNWQQGSALMVTYGGALGNVLVELEDDLDRGVVTPAIRWPGHVTHLELDATGNVKAYRLEYACRDDKLQTYMFRKDVDLETIATYRDGEPWSETGEAPEYENPYGFVPAVWARHADLGGDRGAPAIRSSIGKIDALNDMASWAYRQIGRLVQAPEVLATDGMVVNALDESTRESLSEAEQSIDLLKAPSGTSVHHLTGNLSLADALAHMKEMLKEIEADHPELAVYGNLRSMSSVTGPAIARMLGDVQTLVSRAAAGYDLQSKKLFQMAVAISGWRATSGAWGPLTARQKAFAPFDLGSYGRGELDFEIMPRQLVPEIRTERYAAELQRAQAVQAYVAAKMPLEQALEIVGFDKKTIVAVTKAVAAEPPPAVAPVPTNVTVMPPAGPAAANGSEAPA